MLGALLRRLLRVGHEVGARAGDAQQLRLRLPQPPLIPIPLHGIASAHLGRQQCEALTHLVRPLAHRLRELVQRDRLQGRLRPPRAILHVVHGGGNAQRGAWRLACG